MRPQIKKIITVFLLLTFQHIYSFGQVRYGVEATLNVSNYSIQVPGYLLPTTYWVPGASVGAVLDYGISDRVSLQPGLFYALNGVKYSYSIPFFGSLDFLAHINTIQVPINVMYRFGGADNNRFFVGAGPFLAVNLGGSAKLSATSGGFLGGGGMSFDSSATLKVGSDSTDYIKRFDFGIGANAGYELTNGLFFRIHAQLGFLNLEPITSNGSSMKSMNYNISVGYWFHTKEAKKSKSKSTGRKR